MEFHQPLTEQFTIYSKSGCINCTKVKQLLKENNKQFTIIDCDEFIIEHKNEFLEFIKNLVGKEYKTFPMVFDNTVFVGGYNETNVYLQKILDFDSTF